MRAGLETVGSRYTACFAHLMQVVKPPAGSDVLRTYQTLPLNASTGRRVTVHRMEGNGRTWSLPWQPLLGQVSAGRDRVDRGPAVPDPFEAVAGAMEPAKRLRKSPIRAMLAVDEAASGECRSKFDRLLRNAQNSSASVGGPPCEYMLP